MYLLKRRHVCSLHTISHKIRAASSQAHLRTFFDTNMVDLNLDLAACRLQNHPESVVDASDASEKHLFDQVFLAVSFVPIRSLPFRGL